MLYYDIHRHDQFSLFDGFGTAKDVVKRAKELNYKAVGSTNHGNITGLVKHYQACEEADIIPILGVEAYFQPKIDNEKSTYHLCLYANSKEGWKSLNQLITRSNSDENFYYKPRLAFKDLKEFSEGIVCSSACIGGIIPHYISIKKYDKADKLIKKFKSIYGDRFFIEIMPFELRGEGHLPGKKNLQIVVNRKLLELAKENDVQCIVTSDSHYVRKEDFDSYLKMHEIKNSTIGFEYDERYMPSSSSIFDRLTKFHPDSIEYINEGMESFLQKISDARTWFQFDPLMPSYTDSPEETYRLMKKSCIKKLKEEGKTSNKYLERLKYEFDVIKYHGFQDYFMIVQEYVNWARNHGVAVGPGRGSAGNSLTNYALGITKVDPIYFDNNFDRFLRKDKKKFPDIDVDFGQDKRDKVIEHIIEKYPDRASQTLTYGGYNIKNLINDLAKVCHVEEKEEIDGIKNLLSKYCDDNESTIDPKLFTDQRTLKYNAKYDNIIVHFSKMYGKVRFFGTHASSVILCDENISNRAGLCRIGGNLRTSFDLHDIEYLGLLKLDILGLSTASKVKELEDLTGEEFSYKMLNDKKSLKAFEKGNACVFQFESQAANDIAATIGIDSFEDIVVATSVNRPGPLSLKMHEKYREAKENPDTTTPWYKYTKQTYGTLIYQEQGMPICKEIGGLDAETTDKIVKADYLHIPSDKLEEWRTLFFKGARKYGLKNEEIETIFNSLIQYSFNRGHGVAYSMLSAELMYFKVHYPLEFWYTTLKYENNDKKLQEYKASAVNDGQIIFLPHVNYSSSYSLRKFDGEYVIQEGLSNIKNVGEKAALAIEHERLKNGPYKNYKDVMDRVEKRVLNTRVVKALEESGALEFNEKKYLRRVEQYNSSLFGR